MRLALRIVAVVVLLAAIVYGGFALFEYLQWHGPGLLSRIIYPVGENRPVSWAAGPAEAATPIDQRSPNIIVILVDDMGYNDLTYAGGGVANGAVPTPNIDSIARDGIEFTAGYAGNATCAASRAAIMTGRYPTRFGFEFTPASALFMKMVAGWSAESLRPSIYYEDREDDVPPSEENVLPPEEITIAELLREQGYHTVGLGKWHLGGSPAARPLSQGFDEFLGFRPGGSLFLPSDHPDVVNSMQDFDPIDRFLWANLPFAVRKDGGDRFEPNAYMTDYLSNEAVRVIEANRNRPFFLYLSYNAPHTPLQATREDYDALAHIENHTQRVYGGMMRALDRGIGQVLEALRTHGLEDDTLVVFTSDNGGAHYIGLPDINYPYRGWKMTFFEGGVHTPFFIKWPGGLPGGATFDAPVAHIDVFATAAGAAGAPLPNDRSVDGVNLLPFLRGQATGDPHDALFWRSGHYRSLLAGGWKLQVAERPDKSWLFHLNDDPTEQINLADARPEKLQELRAVLDGIEAEMVEPAWPSLIEGAISIDHPLNVPASPSDEYVYWPN